MNVGELIIALSKLDPSLPVVMQQTDEPLGQYEVLDVSVEDGYADKLYHRTAPTYGGRVWESPQVWHTYVDRYTKEPITKVVLLDSDKPWRPTIDAEVEQKELRS